MKLSATTTVGAAYLNSGRAFLLGTIVAIICACGGAQGPDRGPRGTLRFKGNPPEAQIEIDEVRIGPIRMFEKSGVLLLPGRHRVIVRADGYFTEYRIVEVVQDGIEILEIDLRPIPE